MKTLIQLFENCVNKYNDNVCLLEKKNNKYKGSTFKEIQEKVHQFAAGLISLGVQKGDRIALLSEGRNDWVISELGVLYAGAVNVPLSVKLTEPAEIKFRIEHSGARFAIVSKGQAKKVLQLKGILTQVEKVIILDNQAECKEFEILYSELLIRGKDFLTNNYEIVKSRWMSVKREDYANICYTSGSTADPKGIVLSHRNYIANIEQSLSLFT